MSREPKRNTYVGHRYVPLVLGEWKKNERYEGLTVVTFEGNSYTSKKSVPPGIDIKNKEYWVITGNYNAQIEYYRRDVEDYSEQVTNGLNDVNQSFEDFKTDVNEDNLNHKSEVSSDITSFKNTVNSDIETHKSEVSSDINQFKNTVNSDIETHKSEVSSDINQFKNSVNSDIETHESEVSSDINQFKNTVNSDIETHKSEVSSDIDLFKNTVNSDIDTHKSEVSSDIDNHKTDIESVLKKEVTFNSQTDFLELTDVKTFEQLEIKRINNPYEAISVFAHDQQSHVSHEFRKNTNDDFYIYHTNFVGEMFTNPKYQHQDLELVGNWTDPDNSFNSYTTTIGDTFTFYIYGSNIEINTLNDYRGGIFEIVIDDDEYLTTTLSTYREEGSKSGPTLIVKDLEEDRLHKVVGTYKGADPKSKTPSEHRGWLKVGEGYENRIQNTAYGGGWSNGVYNSPENIMTGGYGSNKEFAFNIEKDGIKEWFPEHNNTGTAFHYRQMQIYLNDELINLEDLDYGDTLKGDKVDIVQFVNFRLPGLNIDLMRMRITYTVDIKGIVTINSNFEILEDLKISSGFVMMLPVNADVFNHFVTGINSNFRMTNNDDQHSLTNEENRVFNYISVDDRNRDLYHIMKIENPINTLRMNDEKHDSYFWIHDRINYPKLYPSLFSDEELKKGDKFKFSGKYKVGTFKNIYDLLKEG